MTLEDVSVLSQIVASVAVVASLIYAALQFRVYAAAAREARYTTAVSDLQEFRKIIATDADCARIYRDGLEDLSKLDSVEQWRFGALMQLVVTNFAYGIKFGDAIEAELQRTAVITTMRRPGAHAWWAKARYTVDAATRATVDDAIESARSGDAS
ncbi:MAG: hypothetical protein JNK07_12115 [Alphaproteobacteria bacterium]|nr:hypothetical protein [Alphaproteobacteria bacterium]